MKELSRPQAYAVSLREPQIIAIAGPGSGKTETAVHRIQAIAKECGRPKTITAITFTNAAADELKRRIGKEVELGYVGTLHGFCLKLIQEMPEASGFQMGMSVIDNDDAEALLKEKAVAMKYRGSMEKLLAIKSEREKMPSQHSLEYLVIQAYFRELRASNTIDFDQILSVGLKTIVAQNGLIGVDHLFVDEYQDSGKMDVKIYAAIKSKKFFVGDPDQAIYGFRGGDITGILEAWKSLAWKACALQENYRSAKNIVKVAQTLINHNTARANTVMVPMRPEEGQCAVFHYGDSGEEMRAIVADLIEHKNFNDSAILCRTNALATVFANTLTAMGMQTRAKRDELPQDWGFVKALALFLINPEANRLATRLLEFQHGKEEAKSRALKAGAAGKSVNKMWYDFKPVATAYGDSFVDSLLSASRPLEGRVTLESETLLRETLGKGKQWGSMAHMTAALIDAGRQTHEDGTGVTVITIHGAKGREWDTVYLPGWEQEIFPGAKTGPALEEERRLAFVGITRAKNRCLVSFADTRPNSYTGRPMAGTASIFFKNMMLEPHES